MTDLRPREGVKAGGSSQVLPFNECRVNPFLQRLVPQRPWFGHAVRGNQVGHVRTASRSGSPTRVALPKAMKVGDGCPTNRGFEVRLRPLQNHTARELSLPEPRARWRDDLDLRTA